MLFRSCGISGLKILLQSAPNDTGQLHFRSEIGQLGQRLGGADANTHGQPELVGKSCFSR